MAQTQYLYPLEFQKLPQGLLLNVLFYDYYTYFYFTYNVVGVKSKYIL